MLTKHNGTDCENELFRNTPFFGVDIADRDRTVNVFWPLRGRLRKKTRENTPCRTHPGSPSITLNN